MASVKGMKWGSTPERDARRELGRKKQKARDRWRNMMRRCYRTDHPKYKHYGGRGITVCERWHDFHAWFDDVGEPPGPNLSWDRIDNNGNYEPGNMRWVTMSVQLGNRRPYKHGPRKNPGPKDPSVI